MDGILAINKPRGMTSHDVVFKLRKILKTKKVGHTGTLDPAVDGVLPICVGRATRVSDYMMDSGKTYIAEVTLGSQTTTEDQTGETISVEPISPNAFSIEDMDAVLQSLVGPLVQTPPMYSAVKVNGRKLYEYAREGKVIERPSRTVQIYAIKRLSQPRFQDDKVIFDIEVACGKGTYIRTLATQIAERLSTVGHMSKLTRTSSGGFQLEESLTLEELAAMPLDHVQAHLLPLERGLKDLPHLEVSADLKDRILNGQKLKQFSTPLTEETVLTYQQQALAIYMPHPEQAGIIKARKVFN
ncbi:tRNA pseudouridine(55) synthase TruB [Macrococcus brunensis]|uniref:tRNA pseudouridine(55) synthase TruB n=1 Tax=Macrococcus brunensis TaxID=198483 RepID=UPI001EF10590|nr:tRNA pseudouridine(55) synthase TruB [Macrococcus brunensis]ULG72926.1 tRNA pseudouridine(55) synthase TruB [Macrococcus brunensis]ULG75174.1 tRNA pseudouridine(55) synthase TruB [Macrococcus brunensis]